MSCLNPCQDGPLSRLWYANKSVGMHQSANNFSHIIGNQAAPYAKRGVAFGIDYFCTRLGNINY